MAPQSLNLLDLPVDVLTLIARLLVVRDEAIPVCPCARQQFSPAAVFLSHPALHAIACPIFYGENVFELDMTGPHGRHVRRCLEDLTPGGQPQNRPPLQPHDPAPEQELYTQMTETSHLLTTHSALRRIHTLHIRLDRLRGWIHTGVVPRLQDMAVRGSLSHVSLSICSTSPSTGPSVSITSSVPVDAGLFARPPMAGLLAVLADPYLRTARLWVGRVHGPAWCGFHGGRCALSDGAADVSRGAPVFGSAPLDGVASIAGAAAADRAERYRAGGGNRGSDGEGLLEVDWRRIVSAVDPEGKGVAVAMEEDLSARRWL